MVRGWENLEKTPDFKKIWNVRINRGAFGLRSFSKLGGNNAFYYRKEFQADLGFKERITFGSNHRHRSFYVDFGVTSGLRTQKNKKTLVPRGRHKL
ncbi:MAG: hypothetical protein CM15mV136_260 [Caudoviricetes sp.]|nr:MAG: hypothetical protein CM15mV136_260 [Caudoviricetes sp.]